MSKFKREERYIVIKRKKLDRNALVKIEDILRAYSIQTVECVVVEKDWPMYELVWEQIKHWVLDHGGKH